MKHFEGKSRISTPRERHQENTFGNFNPFARPIFISYFMSYIAHTPSESTKRTIPITISVIIIPLLDSCFDALSAPQACFVRLRHILAFAEKPCSEIDPRDI
jgi:hypothetical protein